MKTVKTLILTLSLFLFSGLPALAAFSIDPASPVVEGSSVAVTITSGSFPNGLCGFGWSCLIQFAGVNVCVSSNAEMQPVTFPGVVAGTYNTYLYLEDSSSADCSGVDPANFSNWIFNHETSMPEFVVSAAGGGGQTVGQQTTGAISATGEAVIHLFFSDLSSIFTVVAAVLLTMWGINWVLKKF